MGLKIDFKRLKDSFKFAFKGLKTVFKEEQCFRIELAATVFVSIAAFCFPLSPAERYAVFILILLVLASEILNSIIERIMDVVHPSFDGKVEKIKDISSALVLILSIAAAAIGLLIFLPYLTDVLA